MRMQTIQFRVWFKIASDYYDTESNEQKKNNILTHTHTHGQFAMVFTFANARRFQFW